jgi:hypothetical protein
LSFVRAGLAEDLSLAGQVDVVIDGRQALRQTLLAWLEETPYAAAVMLAEQGKASHCEKSLLTS